MSAAAADGSSSSGDGSVSSQGKQRWRWMERQLRGGGVRNILCVFVAGCCCCCYRKCCCFILSPGCFFTALTATLGLFILQFPLSRSRSGSVKWRRQQQRHRAAAAIGHGRCTLRQRRHHIASRCHPSSRLERERESLRERKCVCVFHIVWKTGCPTQVITPATHFLLHEIKVSGPRPGSSPAQLKQLRGAPQVTGGGPAAGRRAGGWRVARLARRVPSLNTFSLGILIL